MGGTPEGARLAQDARHLARACDVFSNSIAQGQGPAELQAAFGPVAAISNRLQVNLRGVQVPPQVQQVWQTYVATESRVRQRLNLPVEQPVRVVERTVVVAQPQVRAMADTLLAEVSSFVQAFAPDARGVPEGQCHARRRPADAGRRGRLPRRRRARGRPRPPRRHPQRGRRLLAAPLAPRPARDARAGPAPGSSRSRTSASAARKSTRRWASSAMPPPSGPPCTTRAAEDAHAKKSAMRHAEGERLPARTARGPLPLFAKPLARRGSRP